MSQQILGPLLKDLLRTDSRVPTGYSLIPQWKHMSLHNWAATATMQLGLQAFMPLGSMTAANRNLGKTFPGERLPGRGKEGKLKTGSG